VISLHKFADSLHSKLGELIFGLDSEGDLGSQERE
jgi:hypothetical protein